MQYPLKIVIDPKTMKIELFNEITNNILIRNPKDLYSKYARNGMLDDILRYYKNIESDKLELNHFDIGIIKNLIKELAE